MYDCKDTVPPMIQCSGIFLENISSELDRAKGDPLNTLW